MTRITTLPEAVAELVHDGDTIALEGFTHLIPVAAGHEIIRQRRQDLTLVRMTPDIVYDQMIGAGCARKLVFSWAGNPGVGSLHRFRDAVRHGWPVPLEIEEHSHAGMANRYVAGAAGLPFAVLRGYAGTDLIRQTPTIKPITCPFTGEVLAAVAALNPDVGIVHAQRADREGNVQVWGITGVHKEVLLASRRSLVTVEEIVERLDPRPGAMTVPSWVIDLVAEVPGGASPSYALGYSDRDNDFYREWDAISRDRERFLSWLGEHVHQENPRDGGQQGRRYGKPGDGSHGGPDDGPDADTHGEPDGGPHGAPNADPNGRPHCGPDADPDGRPHGEPDGAHRVGPHPAPDAGTGDSAARRS